MTLNPVNIANFFFRLNGCATIPNFAIHANQPGESQQTDVDVLAIRFPHHQELLAYRELIKDHNMFEESGLIDIILAEVNYSITSLKGPWENAHDQNLHRLLQAIGTFPYVYLPAVAGELIDYGQFNDDHYRVRLVTIDDKHNEWMLPGSTSLFWNEDVLAFIYDRVQIYQQHAMFEGQWDDTGRELFRMAAQSSQTKEGFITAVQDRMRSHQDKAASE